MRVARDSSPAPHANEIEMNPAADKRELWLLALRQQSVWGRAFKFGFTVGLLQAVVN